MDLTKEQIRKEKRAWRQSLSEQEREQRSRVLRKNIRLQIPSALWIMAFLPFDNEPDILPLLKEWHEQDKQVLVPYAGKGEIKPALFDPKCPYKSAQMECTLWTGDLNRPGVILVPGLAFDKLGNRIGFGKGYYDRFLNNYCGKNIFTYGVAYEEQVLLRVPYEEHDYNVRYVITDRR